MLDSRKRPPRMLTHITAVSSYYIALASQNDKVIELIRRWCCHNPAQITPIIGFAVPRGATACTTADDRNCGVRRGQQLHRLRKAESKCTETSATIEVAFKSPAMIFAGLLLTASGLRQVLASQQQQCFHNGATETLDLH
ncbi:hypothetical protein TNCV_1688181 [Trichonephila clavipes]|nr:hypothetical protein TNCV_1688181 [Trichonephila clavipes]